jgi:hypothetical protein
MDSGWFGCWDWAKAGEARRREGDVRVGKEVGLRSRVIKLEGEVGLGGTELEWRWTAFHSREDQVSP